ncbi:PD-(D/E)XK nuclease family protein [Algiphilus sp.]|uniref:PD-(D/E)XK nuclease family protein n=1 Tax=Algiphilus sp. TaxID=1872431 RepID=UPI003BA9E0A4
MQFFLVPDIAAARRLRRHLVERLGTLQARVGTWPDLIAQARNAWLLPEQQDWAAALHHCLAEATDAFWAASYQADPDGVARAVETGWRETLCAQSPASKWPSPTDARIATRLADLARLNEIPLAAWPENLATVRQVQEQDSGPVRPLTITSCAMAGELDPWQRALIDRINAQSEDLLPTEWQEAITDFEQTLAEPRATSGSRLRVAQETLFAPEQRQWSEEDDGSCVFVGVRDDLESVEIAAALIQQQMERDAELRFADFGILMPREEGLADLLRRSFEHWGIPLGNLPQMRQERDLGRELIRFALMRFEGPIASMAMKALLTNPLLPWTPETGWTLAASLDRNGFPLKISEELPRTAKELIARIDTTLPTQQIPEALASLIARLSADPAVAGHLHRAREAADAVSNAVRAGETDWAALQRHCLPQPLSEETPREVPRESVAVFLEGDIPWRSVRELFVLGFTEGHFPSISALAPIFSSAEWRALAASGVDVRLPAVRTREARERFRQQISQVSERMRVVVPHFDLVGNALSPSRTLTDFALIAGHPDEAESLLVDIARVEDRKRIEGLADRTPGPQQEPRRPEAKDQELGIDLLRTASTQVERPRRLSPSRLDEMLVSPLAWLLRWVGADPGVWEPDDFSPMVRGSIAHKVFEDLFPPGTHQPQWEAIRPSVSDAASHAVSQISPFLNGQDWKVEREGLAGLIERAAERWCQTLCGLDATVVATEAWLRGSVDGAAVHGQADALLSLPERGVVVVDFKTASAARYQQRMERAMDLQASLYREMLATGGPTKTEVADALRALADRQIVGVLYFTLNDGQSCADFEPFKDIPGWRSFENVSQQGLAQLRQRFSELRSGTVRTPLASELKELKRAGIGDYVLKLSPLTAIY